MRQYRPPPAQPQYPAYTAPPAQPQYPAYAAPQYPYSGASAARKISALPLVLEILPVLQLAAIILFGKPGLLIKNAEPGIPVAGTVAPTMPGSLAGYGNTVGGDTSNLPENAVTDATFDMLRGYWIGEFNIANMDGFIEYGKAGGAPNPEQMINDVLAQPAPLELDIYKDGDWDFDWDSESGVDMDLGASMFFVREGDKDTKAVGTPFITGLNSGRFEVNVSMTGPKGMSMSLMFSGVLCEDNGQQYIEGDVFMEATMNGFDLQQVGSYKVYKDE